MLTMPLESVICELTIDAAEENLGIAPATPPELLTA